MGVNGDMRETPALARPNNAAIAVLAALYLGGVAFSCLFGRLDGGIAMVWVPGSGLAAWLYATDRRHWPIGLIACALANELGAGLFGMGWTAGIGLTLANLVEAVAAALLARHTLRAHWPDATFEIASQFLLGAALVIPAGSALIAAGTVHAITGGAFAPVFRNWMLGHAVGLTALLPFAVTAAIRLERQARTAANRRRDDDRSAPSHRPVASTLMVLTMALLTACVFMQDARWPMVAPLLFALFAAVWADALIATAMPMLVALIAAPLTVAGLGPIAPGLLQSADRLQLGLLYAGLIAGCVLPVVVEQARRRQQLAVLSRSAAHFQAMSQRADTLIDELRRAALTDPLTLLPNRRAFFETLYATAQSGEPACLAMIDIDHFKRVNDRLGHAAGDTVLRHFADLARASFRKRDMVGRIGGEEFAVILRGVDLDQACKVCQRLVDKLAETEIATPMGPVCVTISSGVAVIGADGDAAMAAADSAMYQAKRAGRSRLASVA
jgi:diguanylate cyclase (GGDEF)-like protein